MKKKRIKNGLRYMRDLGRLSMGAIAYLRTGATTDRAYQALIRLFCASSGAFNDRASWWVGLWSPKRAMVQTFGVLGDMRGAVLADSLAKLREHGYLMFPAALPPAVCDRLMEFAMQTPALRRRMDGEDDSQRKPMAVLFDPARPDAVRYDYQTQSLLDNADVQQLLADGSILALVQEYLGSLPKADILSMWWHTNFHQQPDSEAAQFYHFDMDRIKWLKLFVYVTDVSPRDGPHSFVAGSHRTRGIPQALLQKGYVRLTDDEIVAHYGTGREVEFSAPRGTIIVEDTRGLHKGKPVAVDGASRLVLQLQFSNSLFGANTPKSKISSVLSREFAEVARRHPDIYRQYL